MQAKSLEENVWRWARRFYIAGLFLLGMSIAFYFGPNLVMFGKLTRLSVNDFVPIATTRFVPVIREIKEYEQEHGGVPLDVQSAHLVFVHNKNVTCWFDVPYQEVIFTAPYRSEVVYYLDQSDEHFEVRSDFMKGRLPIPTVIVPASTTRPASY